MRSSTPSKLTCARSLGGRGEQATYRTLEGRLGPQGPVGPRAPAGPPIPPASSGCRLEGDAILEIPLGILHILPTMPKHLHTHRADC